MTSSAMRLSSGDRASGGIVPVNGLLPKHRVMREGHDGMPAPAEPNQALAREKALIAMRSVEYGVLLQKIKDYQCRSVSAPSDTEMEKWRECMEYRIATRKLQIGIVDLQVFPNCGSLPLN
jgi:hypothetical protein